MSVIFSILSSLQGISILSGIFIITLDYIFLYHWKISVTIKASEQKYFFKGIYLALDAIKSIEAETDIK